MTLDKHTRRVEQSKIRLAQEIMKLGNPAHNELIQMLLAGKYDKFSDDDDSLMLTDLVDHMRQLGGLEALAKQVIDGDFDANSEDSRHWAERQTGETSRLIDIIGSRSRGMDRPEDDE